MSKRNIVFIGAGLFALAGVAILSLQIPAINDRVSWRYEVAKTYMRNVLHPVGAVPTAIPNPTSTRSPASPTAAVTPTTQVAETPIPPTATLAPPPAQAFLNSPPFEKQTAVLAAELFNKTGRRRGSRFDCLIAASAILAQAEVATINESDFKLFVPHGLKLAVVPPPPPPSALQAATGSN